MWKGAMHIKLLTYFLKSYGKIMPTLISVVDCWHAGREVSK